MKNTIEHIQPYVPVMPAAVALRPPRDVGQTVLQLWQRVVQWGRLGNESVSFVRISCFFAIALGMLSLMNIWARLDNTAIRVLLVPPEEALGFIFLGFAVRMTRLEAYRSTIRVVVRTSRVCLLVLGASMVLGWRLSDLGAFGFVASGDTGTSLAVGICYFLMGFYLKARGGQSGGFAYTVLSAMLFSYLGSCWIAQILYLSGLVAVPRILMIRLVSLSILTAGSVALFSLHHKPSLLRRFAQTGPDEETIRSLFPLAFAIPVVLAILRYRAESSGLIVPDVGLLLHVLFSAGAMILMISYSGSRARAARVLRDSKESTANLVESQYRDVMQSIQDPVWIFSSEGHLTFRNDAARGLFPPDGEQAASLKAEGAVLGTTQQRVILSSALLGQPVSGLAMRDSSLGSARKLPIRCLRVLHSHDGRPGSIILIAGA
jgi:PAS domain-containing protein